VNVPSPHMNSLSNGLKSPSLAPPMRPAGFARTLLFVLRVAVLAIIAFPVLADDSLPTLVRSPLAVPPVPGETNGHAEGFSVGRPAVPSADEESAIPFVGDACHPNYWIVSSRCSIQNMRRICREPWGLDVHQRTPDGQLHRSDMPSLSSQLVPGVPVGIFVHGSFVKWENQCREAHQAYVRLRSAAPDRPVQMIFFTWPSDGPYTYLPTIDVAVRGRQAEFNGFHLAWLISQIPESSPVCLMAHSHGARAVFSAMHLAAGGTVQDHVFPYSMGTGRRYRIVLAAAALDHHWLRPGKRYDRALHCVECVLNFRNRHDLALTAYSLHRPFVRRAIGKSGLTSRDVRKIGWNSAKVQEYDVTHLLGRSHLWPEYYNQPAITGAIVPYLYFQ
jgi:hypothetical protein